MRVQSNVWTGHNNNNNNTTTTTAHNMAFMVSNFTSADRRKKVVTYGKKPRPSIIPTPSPDPTEEPPSPERPRKVVTTTKNLSTSCGKAPRQAKATGNARAVDKEPDIFEVPSDDESTFRPIIHAKRLSKHRITAKVAPSTRTRKEDVGTTLQPPLKSRGPKAVAPRAKVAHNPDQLPASTSPHASSRQSQSVSEPQAHGRNLQQHENEAKRQGVVSQPVARGKVRSRVTTPGVPQINSSTKSTRAYVVISNNSVKAPVRTESKHVDVFDMPLSDEEVAVPPRRSSRLGYVGKAKENERQGKLKTAQEEAPKTNTESDSSNASRKRKRREPVSSLTIKDATVEFQSNTSALERDHKSPRRGKSPCSSHEPVNHTGLAHLQEEAPSTERMMNKPRRTRQFTVPVFNQRNFKKGKSSPAQLTSMLPNRSLVEAPPVVEAPEAEDETMYEIPDALATPLRPSKNPGSGSVTPRQKALFNNLLGDGSSSTPMPSISALRLTDKNTQNLHGGLTRSRSDLTCSVQARKTRLIDTLKHVEDDSEDEGNDDTSDDDNDTSNDSQIRQGRFEQLDSNKQLDKPHEARLLTDVYSEDMDIDSGKVVETQASQAASTFSSRAKFTYAKSRSYLEEANPEDALLISMGLDDDVSFELKNKDSPSEDEEDFGSQVQAHHVLKRKGQQNRFNDDVRMYIDDLRVTSSNPVRRNAMLELCCQMEDEGFTSQLLDSTLANQFFENLTSNGEIIFDFAAAVAIIFLLDVSPTSIVLDQIYRTGIVTSLVQLTSNELEIQRVAKNRKTNLSKIAVESVTRVRDKLLACSIWSKLALDKATPQLVALKALESIVLGLRRSGNADSIFDVGMVSTIIDIAPKISQEGTVGPVDIPTLRMLMSILESVSISRQKQTLWSMKILERLADIMPIVFGLDDASSIVLAVKLCMNLTNNRPKACLPFSGQRFIQSLAAVVLRNFARLYSDSKQDDRTAVLESLILGLGALINLAEFSDQARLNMDAEGEHVLGTLVKIFLEGSERAAQAQSMEESRSNVPVGYLTVLLGNLCLNRSIRAKVRAELPDQRLDMLIDKIKEFVQYHEHVDSKTKEYQGTQGRETWQNYTARLLLVVEKLERS